VVHLALATGLNWADEAEEEEEGRETRESVRATLKAKYATRSERFGTEARVPTRPAALDSALGGRGRGGERLPRLEVMRLRREAAAAPGFPTGFDVTSPEERRKAAERAARYAGELATGPAPLRTLGFGFAPPRPAVAEVVEPLEPRREAATDAPVRPEVVYMYGVDALSTKDCMGYWRDYAPVFCEWINDSSCNIVFADAFSARRALAGLGTPMASEMEEEGEAATAQPRLEWFSGPPVVTQTGAELPMCFRIATEADVKPDGRTVSRWLWRGGAPPPPPRRAVAGRKRRSGKRGRNEEAEEEEEAPAEPEEDLRAALKRRRAEAPAVAPAVAEMGDAAEAVAADVVAEDTPAAPPPPLEGLPAGDLRGALQGVVPDFGDDMA